MPNFGKEGACGDFNDFSNSALRPDYTKIPFSNSNSDDNLFFWQLVNKKIDDLQENSPSLFMDAKRKALFDYDDKIGNFDNLYYPLMVMWYFIGATMTMLILAGILILERPAIGSKNKTKSQNQENNEITESDTSSTTYETGESNPSQEDDAVPDKTEIDQSQVDIKPAAAAPKNEETISKIQARQRVSSRISQRIAESLQISMPAGYLPNPANKNLDITGASEVEGGKTVVKEDGSIVQEKVGLFSIKLATQPSFVCHSVAQLLLVWGGAVFLIRNFSSENFTCKDNLFKHNFQFYT